MSRSVATGRAAGQAVGLVVAGFLLLLVGAAVWSACSSGPTVNGIAPNCGGLALFVLFGVVLILAGIGYGLYAAFGAPHTIYPSVDPAVPPPLIHPVVVQQTVVQQTVEVRCRYCGGLNPVTATTCSACGAAL